MASLHGWFSPRIVVQAPIMREGLFITVAPTVSGLAPSYTIQHMEGETNVTTGAATTDSMRQGPTAGEPLEADRLDCWPEASRAEASEEEASTRVPRKSAGRSERIREGPGSKLLTTNEERRTNGDTGE